MLVEERNCRSSNGWMHVLHEVDAARREVAVEAGLSSESGGTYGRHRVYRDHQRR